MPSSVPSRCHCGVTLPVAGSMGAGIALAQVDAEGDAVEPFDHGIVGGDRALEIALGILAARTHAVERDLVDIGM